MARATLRWTIAALAPIVLVAVAFVVRHRSTAVGSPMPAPPHAVTARDATHRPTSLLDSRAGGAPIAAPSRDEVARDPDAAARTWYGRALGVIAVRRRRTLGDDVAALMALPYDQAMPELRSRALDGDAAAAKAIAEIVIVCNAEASRRAGRPSPHSSAATRWPHLPPAWAAFADRLDADFWSAHAERTDHCPDGSGIVDVFLQIADRYLTPDNVEARIDIAAEGTDNAQALADLRALVANGAGARAEFFLADRLLTGTDPAGEAEGLAMFERLAADDSEIALRLGYCFSQGCGDFKPRPYQAMPWIEQAAGSGEFSAYTLLLPRLDAAGDAADAWAWALYRLDLALDGCFELSDPAALYIGYAANDESRRREALSPSDYNAGLAHYHEISGRWEKLARERRDCAD